MADTIAAIATAQGRSGIAVIRISGPNATEYIEKLAPGSNLKPRNATLRTLLDPQTSEAIDNVILTYFKAPHSYTGEDVVEISTHGSPVILRQILDCLLALGARAAGPGEFTLRAVATGKIDLTQAEAIRDLINAQTKASARLALRQMKGELAAKLDNVKELLLDAIVRLESALEFVEDDLPPSDLEDILAKIASAAESIVRIASTFSLGKKVRDGVRVALAGLPNVGKSSIFNALIGDERAIVTDIPGTTRDQLRESFLINNVPVTVVDTAGLRASEDKVEQIGVERSKRAIADADIVLGVFDASREVLPGDLEILNGLGEQVKVLVLNKIDLVQENEINDHEAKIGAKLIPVSAKCGKGLDELKEAIASALGFSETETEGFLLTDARHFDLLKRAEAEVINSMDLIKEGKSEEIVLVGLHNAMKYLGEIVGETTTDDILTRIFSTFCIGK